MLRALFRSVVQLPDPAIRRVLLRAAFGTVGLFAMLATGIAWGLARAEFTHEGWLDTTLGALGGAGALILAWLLFPAVMITLSSLMLEEVAQAVERRWYPHLGPPRPAPLWESLWEGLKFLTVVVGLNLLALPLLFLTGPFYLAGYYALNGYLLGREYFELVASRRHPPGEVRDRCRGGGTGIFLAGLVIALISSLPVVNLLAPVLATAFMLHRFESWRGEGPPHLPSGRAAW